MADLLVRGLPEDLHARYKRLAQKHHRSLPAETIHLIEQAVEEEEDLERRRAALARLAKRRREQPSSPSGVPDGLSLLREDRSR